MFTYKQILNDKFIQQIYNSVDKYEPNPWSTHGLSHIERVINYAKQIYSEFNLNADFNECLIACALHDVGAIMGKNGHNLRSYNFAKGYLSFTDLTEEQKQKICNAILHHGQSNDNSSLLLKVLVLADKLDITKQRVLPFGNTVLGMRQMANINNVSLNKTNNALFVNIETNDNFNVNEWQDYYFTKKVYNSISVMAKHFNVEHIVNFKLPNNEVYLSTNLSQESILTK